MTDLDLRSDCAADEAHRQHVQRTREQWRERITLDYLVISREWRAILRDDPEGYCGTGRTENDAMDDLIAQVEEDA